MLTPQTFRMCLQRSILASVLVMRRLVSTNSSLPRSCPGRTINLFLDFDGTVTEKDTLNLVANAGYAVQDRHRTSSPLPPSWQEIVDTYLDDYNAHSVSYNPIKSQRSSIRQEGEWLNSLQPIEDASSQRASKAEIFDDVLPSDIAIAAQEALRNGQVRLRSGCSEFISYVYARNSQLPHQVKNSPSATIISVNWSRSFIHAIMTEAFTSATDNPISSSVSPAWIKTLRIYANELPSIADHITPQEMVQPIRTSGDKLQRFNSLVSKPTHSNERTIYIGDSVTDLECLLAAHTGICIRDHDTGSSQQELAETCDRISVDVRHISEKPDLEKSSNVLWWAHGFAEIQCWLESIEFERIP